MSSLLQTYEEDFKECIQRTEEELASIRRTCIREGSSSRVGGSGGTTLSTTATSSSYVPPPPSGPQSRLQRCTEVSRTLNHLQEMISNMEYESHDAPSSQRQVLRHRIGEYEKQLRSVETLLGAVKGECSIADRLDLTAGLQVRGGGQQQHPGAYGSREGGKGGGGGQEIDDPDEEHRRIMMNNTEQFRNASRTLEKAERVLNDTEVVGGEALQNLRKQTEQLQGLHEITIAVDEEVSETRRIVNRLQRGMIKHKAILVGMIVFLFFLIIVAIYVWVRKHTNNTYVSPTPEATVPPPVAPSDSTAV